MKTLTKSTVWDASENDIFRLMGKADPDAEGCGKRLMATLRSAFLVEELKGNEEAMKIAKAKYEKLGWKVGTVCLDEKQHATWALKKRPIQRVTDLTYENIRHISAAKLVEVLDCNFGGGWDSLSQSIKDIIESGFDVSTTTLPASRLRKKGGMYEKKTADGYEALCVEKGSWVEAVFVKAKPEPERPHVKIADSADDSEAENDSDTTFDSAEEEDTPTIEPAEEEMTEDNYSTMVEMVSEDTDSEAAEVADDNE